MKNIDKALFIILVFVIIVIFTNYVFGFSVCMTSGYKERFVNLDYLKQLNKTKLLNSKSKLSNINKTQQPLINRGIYSNEEIIALTINKNNTYKVDSSIHINIDDALKNTDFVIRYVTDYNSARKYMPLIKCTASQFPFYIIVSTDNNYTIFNNNNNLILIDITDVQVIDYVVFKDISYKAPIISKPTTKPLANSKQIELKLNNGNNNINLNLNIDNKAYNKIKEVYEIQKTVDQNIPRLKIKNNCY